jgi:hypothetical protein
VVVVDDVLTMLKLPSSTFKYALVYLFAYLLVIRAVLESDLLCFTAENEIIAMLKRLCMNSVLGGSYAWVIFYRRRADLKLIIVLNEPLLISLIRLILTELLLFRLSG